MNKEIITFAQGLKDRYNIDLTVVSQNGEVIIGNLSSPVILGGNGIVQDEQTQSTVFPLAVKGQTLYGVIEGSGKTEENYAMFISQLAGGITSTEREMTRLEFYKAVLFGSLPFSQTVKYQQKFNLPNSSCAVLLIAVNRGGLEDVFNVLSSSFDDSQAVLIPVSEDEIALIKFAEKKDDYSSFGNFAEYLESAVFEETGLSVKVFIGGEVKSIADVNQSYLQAENAQRICLSISAKGNIFSYKEFIIIKILEDLPKDKLKGYLNTLLTDEAKGLFADQDMVATAEEYLESGMNICETARKLYIHRNTLSYRLEKIEKCTGLNIRKFSDAMIFRMIRFIQKIAE